MSYGLMLQFDGYPPMEIDSYNAVVPIGTYYHQASNLVGSFSVPYQVAVPSAAIKFGCASGYSGNTDSFGSLPLRITAVSAGVSAATFSYSAIGSTVFPFSVVAAHMTADCTALSSSEDYGLFFKNDGVKAILDGSSPPMRVAARYTANVTASSKVALFSCAELDAVRSGASYYTFYVGVTNNAYFCVADVVPKNRTNWNSGAYLRLRFFPAAANNKMWRGTTDALNGTFNIKVLVAGAAITSMPTGYGFVVRNGNAQVTMSQNSVPVLCGAVASFPPMPASLTQTSTLGPAQTVPAKVQGMTALFPAGLSRRTGQPDPDYARTIWFQPTGSNTSISYFCDIYKGWYNNQIVNFTVMEEAATLENEFAGGFYRWYGKTSFDFSTVNFGVVFDGEYFA